MKIVITGATGGLGRYLVSELSSEVTLKLLGRSREKLQNLFHATGNVGVSEVDYSVESLLPVLDGVQGVIHLAGIRPGVDISEPDLYRENVRITTNLFDACRCSGISNVVFASSTSVYTPGIDSAPFIEEADLFPSSLYAASKLASEKAGNAFGLRVKSLRIASVIGLGERKEYMRMAYLHRALRKEPLFIYGDGTGQREYVYAKDVARAIKFALAKPELSAVINIGSGRCISQCDYADLVNQVFAGGGCKIVFLPEKAGYRGSHVMSSKKAENLLGYTPRYSLEAALWELKQDMMNENSFQ